MSCIQTSVYEIQGVSIQFLFLWSFTPGHKEQSHRLCTILHLENSMLKWQKLGGERTNLFLGPTVMYSRTLQCQVSGVGFWMGMSDVVQT